MCLSILEPAPTKMLPKRRAAKNASPCQNGAGWFDYDIFAEKILPYVDLVLFDVKLV